MGLVDARISAHENDLPVLFGQEIYKKQIKVKKLAFEVGIIHFFL